AQPRGAVVLPGARERVGVAELRVAGAAARAVAAGGDEREDAAVAGSDVGDACADGLDGTRALVTEDAGQGEHRRAAHDVVVAGAHARRTHAYEHLAGARPFLL